MSWIGSQLLFGVVKYVLSVPVFIQYWGDVLRGLKFALAAKVIEGAVTGLFIISRLGFDIK